MFKGFFDKVYSVESALNIFNKAAKHLEAVVQYHDEQVNHWHAEREIAHQNRQAAITTRDRATKALSKVKEFLV